MGHTAVLYQNTASAHAPADRAGLVLVLLILAQVVQWHAMPLSMHWLKVSLYSSFLEKPSV